MAIIVTIITAFASGVLGACLGAMPSVIMCGVGVCIGMVGAVSGSGFDWLSNMAFGMFLGPQVSFAPACVAAAYAKKRGYIESSKDIFLPLISIKKPDVLVVGGLFAVAGWYINVAVSAVLPGRIDNVACTIVILSMIGRTMFAGNGLKGLIGDVPEGKKRFDCTCSDSWIEYQSTSNPLQILLLGLGVGCISAWIVKVICDTAVATGNEALYAVAAMPVWGIAIVWCMVMAAGCNVPVAHHIGLVAGYATKMAYLGGGADESCIFWGIAFGLVAAYAGDWLGKLFTAYGEGYVDPPSMAITFWSVFLLWLLPEAGFTNPESPFYYIIPVAVFVILVLVNLMEQKKLSKNKLN